VVRGWVSARRSAPLGCGWFSSVFGSGRAPSPRGGGARRGLEPGKAAVHEVEPRPLGTDDGGLHADQRCIMVGRGARARRARGPLDHPGDQTAHRSRTARRRARLEVAPRYPGSAAVSVVVRGSASRSAHRGTKAEAAAAPCDGCLESSREEAMSIYAECRDSFRTLARVASKSIAEPPWFATPVNAEEDRDSVTVYFHVPGKSRSQAPGSGERAERDGLGRTGSRRAATDAPLCPSVSRGPQPDRHDAGRRPLAGPHAQEARGGRLA